MQDIVFLLITLAFFAIAGLYVRGLEKLRGDTSDE